ncbi:TPA: hypothetical protein MIC13_24810 [Klebsiella pneumoniae]|uniref:hypothetical protein n=1 Tax=Klebsiella pneumoniae TaxID=573 RepID=UPI0024B0721A|nr:hypothetical protein [Klebsiella pneumoniae]MDI9044649.1 hypothetical protein [Klebsiella pneumoniae]HBR1963958.1 hypothetical protein [Klebsiella pneumoniae]HBR1979604.1 hypothetical protein [Klebsiella pneumoniae]HBX7040872.1 hypothetical protein [Klebsiella pneumoniae]HBX7317507.1 hypothetical protein [Klebsiella pneumoniae]
MLFLDWPPQFEAAYRDLLSIRTEDDLTRILLRNAQYLRMRTSQVLPRGQQFYAGTALYFALFCDVAGRDEQTIEAFWASIGKRQVTAACDSSPGIASLELRLI